MLLSRPRSAAYWPPGTLRARHADKLVDCIMVGTHHPPGDPTWSASPNYFPAYNNPTTWLAAAANLGIRHIRDEYEWYFSGAPAASALFAQQIADAGMDYSMIIGSIGSNSAFQSLQANVGLFTTVPATLECSNEADNLGYVHGDYLTSTWPAWSSSTTYAAGVGVSYGGYYYVSLQAGNLNNTPQLNVWNAANPAVDNWWVMEWAYNNRLLTSHILSFRDTYWPKTPVLTTAQYTWTTRSYLGYLGTDIANLHDYTLPGAYADSGYYMGALLPPVVKPDPCSITKRTWITEYGFQSALTPSDNGAGITHLSEDSHAKLLLRGICYGFALGAERIGIYELMDKGIASPDGNQWGLFHSDLTPKVVANNIQSLTTLLADPGPAFTPGALGVAISGNTPEGYLLLQKRDLSFWLLLWNQVGLTSLPNGGTGANPHTNTATLTNGSTSVTNASAVSNDLGASLAGTGVPAGAYVTAVTPGSGYTMSAAATTSGSVSLTVTPFSSGAQLPGSSISVTLNFSPGVTSLTAYRPFVGTTAQPSLLSGAVVTNGKTTSVVASAPADVIIVKIVV